MTAEKINALADYIASLVPGDLNLGSLEHRDIIVTALRALASGGEGKI